MEFLLWLHVSPFPPRCVPYCITGFKVPVKFFMYSRSTKMWPVGERCTLHWDGAFLDRDTSCGSFGL